MAKFKFKYGTMNSGKSQELHRIWYSYTGGDVNSKRALLVVPSIDTRFGVGKVTTRAGATLEALTVEPGSMFDTVLLNITKEVECILVDEVQFFSREDIFELKSILMTTGIPVIAFGLLTDFQNNIFEGTQAVLAVAEEISEIETICSMCTSKAIMNLRLGDNKDVVAIEGEVEYLPVCHKHYLINT